MTDSGWNIFSDLADPRGWPASARYLAADLKAHLKERSKFSEDSFGKRT